MADNSFRPSQRDLDPTDLRLLAQLQARPRVPMAELARQVGMSAPAVSDRVQRLEHLGVIRGYRLELDPSAIGLGLAAYVRVRPAPGHLPQVADLARDLPQVVECHRITGEDCFLLRVQVAGVGQLETVLDRFLAHGQTVTSVVQSSPVPLRPLPLPGLPEKA